jgi:hypothetical protein
METLRQLGNMLKETPRNKGAYGTIITGDKRVPVMDSTPTLAELGIDKKISSLAQKVASLPKENRQTRRRLGGFLFNPGPDQLGWELNQKLMLSMVFCEHGQSAADTLRPCFQQQVMAPAGVAGPQFMRSY